MDQEKVLMEKDGENTPVLEKEKTSKKKPGKDTIIFYSIYGSLVALVLIALFCLMIPLRNWLAQYEASQPENKQAEVFAQLFEDPDWEALYTQAQLKDTIFESKQAYAAYMNEKVGDAQLGCMETSAGLSGDRKYVIRLGEEKIATFTLCDTTKGQETIANWELSALELFMTRQQRVTVEILPEHTAYINGVALDDSYTIRTVETKAESYLPEGLHGYRMKQQYVDGLLVQPEVTVRDADGNMVETRVEENGVISAMPLEEMVMSQEDQQLAIDVAKTNALFAIRAVSRWTVADYFDDNSQIYTDIVNTTSIMQKYTRYNFVEESIQVRNYYRYSDEFYSANVSLQLNVTRTNGTIKTYDSNTTYFFTKMEDGAYRVTDMTNISIQERTEQVRLAFNMGEKVESYMVDVDTKMLTLPQVEVPQGQSLVGWAKQEKDENGRNVLAVVFSPAEDGVVYLSGEELLEPMVLYPVFE